jgi:cytochrome P450
VSQGTGRPGAELAARLLDPGLYETDPHPLYARLRAEAPLAWNEEKGFWAVSTHPEVMRVATDTDTFCSSKGILVDEIGVEYAAPPTILHTDPPEHTRYRKLVMPAFKQTAIKAIEARVRSHAKTLVGALEPGRAIDVVPVLSVPFPLQVICELLGVDGRDWQRFYEWSEAIVPGATELPADTKAKLQGEMYAFLVEVAMQRRASPTDDVVSALATAEIDGDKLTNDELTMFLVQLLVAGNETTRNLISGSLAVLSQRPEDWSTLRSSPQSIPTAVEELVRWTSPVISFMRTATKDTTIRGQRIAAGEPVLMLFASANRDEEVFGETASCLMIGRDPNPHLGFGFGAHFCLGAALARLEARVVMEELLARFSSIEPGGPVVRGPSPVVAGYRSVPIVFGT